MTVSRESVRDGLAGLINTAVVAAGLPADMVYAYLVADFGKRRSIVTVTWNGTRRERYTHQGNRPTFYLMLNNFVLYADANTTPPWTEANAEDRLDTLEAIEAGVLEAHRVYPGYWGAIDYDARSTVMFLDQTELGGNKYWVEEIPVKVEVF